MIFCVTRKTAVSKDLLYIHALSVSRFQEKEKKGGNDNKITINVPVVYMVRYKVVLRGDYP